MDYVYATCLSMTLELVHMSSKQLTHYTRNTKLASCTQLRNENGGAQEDVTTPHFGTFNCFLSWMEKNGGALFYIVSKDSSQLLFSLSRLRTQARTTSKKDGNIK